MSYSSDAITAPLGRARGAGLRGLGPWQIGGLLAVLIAFAVAGNFVFAKVWGTGDVAPPAYSIGAVGRQTITSFANASGTINATRQVKLSFTAAGRVAKLSVKQGDQVEEGQEIAQLDQTTLAIKRDTAQSQLDAAQLRLQALLDGPTAADLTAQQQAVASAQANLTRAQNDLTNLINGITAEDVAAARASLDRARAALDVAQANYDKLARGDDLTLRSEYTQLQSARADYQTALTNYNNKVAPPTASDLAAAQNGAASGRAAVDAAQSRLNQLLNPNPADIAAAQSSVSSAQAQLEAAKNKYAATYIGGTLSERQAAQAAVDAAQAALDAALAKRSAVLSTAGSSEADVLAAESAVTQAQSALLTAKNNLVKAQGQQGGSDLATAEQGVRAAETALATAQSSLTKLLSPLPSDLAAAQQQLAAAQSTLATAQGALDKLTQGPNADDLAQLQAALDRSKAALDTAQTSWDRLVNKVDLDQRPETAALNSAKSDYAAALSSYTLKSTGPKAGDVSAAQASVDSARSALGAAQAKMAQLQAGPLATDVGQQQEAVNQLALALKSAQNDLDNAVLRAPFAGTIVTVGVNEGDQVGANAAIASLLDPTLVRVDATLDESSLTKVKAGQPALVSFDAIQGRQFVGQVAVVTPAGITQQGVVTFPVTIVFNSQGVTIPAGLTATVRIVTERKDNVTTVPSRAIKRQGRETVVDIVLDNGKLESRPIQVGITGDTGQVEILSGLNEGDRVAIPSAQARTGQQQGGAFGAGGLPGLGAPAAAPRR